MQYMKAFEITEYLAQSINDPTITVTVEGEAGTLLKITPRSKLMAAISTAITMTVPHLNSLAGERGSVEFVEITESGSVIAQVTV